MKKFLFLILTIMVCSSAFAQNEGRENKNKQNPADKQKFEQMKADIQSRKIAFFTKQLKLSSEEAKVFWPVYYKCEEERDAARNEIRKSAHALHSAIREDKADSEIKALADTYYAALERDNDLQKLHYYEYLKVLPVKKAAMVRMVEERFVNDLLSQWRRRGNGPQDKNAPKPAEPKNGGDQNLR